MIGKNKKKNSFFFIIKMVWPLNWNFPQCVVHFVRVVNPIRLSCEVGQVWVSDLDWSFTVGASIQKTKTKIFYIQQLQPLIFWPPNLRLRFEVSLQLGWGWRGRALWLGDPVWVLVSTENLIRSTVWIKEIPGSFIWNKAQMMYNWCFWAVRELCG